MELLIWEAIDSTVFLRSLVSVDHILDFCFHNLSCLREYREKCAGVLRLGIVQLVDCGLELRILCYIIFKGLLLISSCCYREVTRLGIPVC